MLYDIEVRHKPGNGDYFQPYKEIGVSALTSHDAVAKIQRQNPGCQVWCCNSYNEPCSNSSSSSNSGDTEGYFYLALILGALYVTINWWYFVIPGAIILGTFYYWSKRNGEE